MKLKLIKKKTGKRSGPPRISFGRNGYLTINAAAQEKYGLKAGVSVAILQDEDKPDDFYLITGTDKDWPTLRPNSGGSQLICGYSDARNILVDQFRMDDSGFRIYLGGQIKTEYGPAICLITAPLIDAREKSKEVSNG